MTSDTADCAQGAYFISLDLSAHGVYSGTFVVGANMDVVNEQTILSLVSLT
jgi:hypothetical protein